MDRTEQRLARQSVRAVQDAIWSADKVALKNLTKRDSGVNWNMPYKGRTCLQMAVESGDTDLVDIVLDAGASVDEFSDNVELPTPIMLACHLGYLKLVELLIDRGASVNLPNNKGKTVLMVACDQGRLDIVNVLLQAGASIDFTDCTGLSALHVSVMAGHGDIVEHLVRKGCDLNQMTRYKKTSLLLAVNKPGQSRVVETLLLAGCERNICDLDHNTALMLAIKTPDCCEYVRLLLDYGADCSIPDSKRVTPLLEAVMRQNYSVVQLILSRQPGLATIDSADYRNVSPIMAAVRDACTFYNFSVDNPSMDIIRLLLQHGCSLSIAESSCGWTPLFVSTQCGNKVITELLLTHGADVNARDRVKDSLLHTAVQGSREEIINHLISAGCEVNSVNNSGETPLYRAVLYKAPIKIVKKFIDAGANLDIADVSQQRTALHIAIDNGYTECAALLIEQGCDINHCDFQGTTALTKAVGCGNVDVVSQLLSLNCDLDKGREFVALHTAVRRAEEGLINRLIDRGADINLTNQIGIRPIQEAIESNQRRIIRCLLNLGCTLDPTEGRLLVPKSCCRAYHDAHPHAELQPLFAVIKFDDFELFKLLLSYYHRQPWKQLHTIHDLITLAFDSGNRATMLVSSETRKELLLFLRQELSAPWTLLALSRGAVRQALGVRPKFKVEHLSIPVILKHYLVYNTKQYLDLSDLENVLYSPDD